MRSMLSLLCAIVAALDVLARHATVVGALEVPAASFAGLISLTALALLAMCRVGA